MTKMSVSLYILERMSKKTGNLTYYTGITNNFKRRLAEHRNGNGSNKGYWVVYGREIYKYMQRGTAMRLEKFVKKLPKKLKYAILYWKKQF